MIHKRHFVAALQSHLNVIGLNLKGQLDRITQLGVPIHDIEGFDQQCQEITDRHPYIQYAMVVQGNGTILFHNAGDKAPKSIHPQHLALLQQEQNSPLNCDGGRSSMINQIIPLHDSNNPMLASSIVIGVPSQIIHRRVLPIILSGLIMGGVALLAAGSLLVMGISKTVTHPLHQAVQTIEEISHSTDLSQRIKVTSNDEIGILAQAFNRMIENLQQSTTSIDHLNLEIEQRIQAEEGQRELLAQVEQTNAELKNFAHIVSHDLKAPLRGITSLANWIQADYTDKLDEDGKEQLQLLTQRVERMQLLIDGILKYSRAGQSQGEPTPVELSTLLPEIIDDLGVPEHIQISLPQQLPLIQYDPTRIRQVFQNLLSNAVKYMDKNQGRIHVEVTDNDQEWTFSIADNGPGIEEKYFDKIFGIFQTLVPKDQYQSTGVGLAVVKKIIENSGGRIWLTSQVNEGCTFRFTVPKQTIACQAATC